MAWETRRGVRYYYRGRRVDGRVRKQYFGHGDAAMTAAIEDQSRAKKRQTERDRQRAFESSMWPIERRMAIIRGACKKAYHTAHYLAGYRQDRHYIWRRSKEELELTETANDIDRNEPSHPSTIEETLQLLRQGRRDLIPHLRWQLKQVPDLWSHAGDLGRLTQSALARAIAGDNDLVRESIMLVADRDRQDLAGDGGSATQRLLAERVVLSRMQLANYVQMEAQNSVALLGTRLGAAVSKRLQSGERQLRESIRQLEIARRLESEIRPRRPAASLKIYDPARIKKTA